MVIVGEVLSVTTDNRQIVDTRSGAVKQLSVTNVLIKSKDGEILTCKTYNPLTVSPVAGKEFKIDVRKYEKMGLVGNVTF